MNKVLTAAVLATALAVSACAKPPSKIAPTAVSSNEYAGLSCQQLNAQLRQVRTDLEAAEKKQREKVAGDAVVVFLILVPPSTMAGDYEAEVALLKGEVIAIERAIDKRRC